MKYSKQKQIETIFIYDQINWCLKETIWIFKGQFINQKCPFLLFYIHINFINIKNIENK